MKTLTITDEVTIEAVAGSCRVCYLSMIDDEGLPYLVPMNYVWHDGVFYLHSGVEGTKVDILRKRPYVCLALHRGEELICQHPDVACSYSMVSTSIICRGKVQEMADFDDKQRCLDIFMSHYVERKFKYSAPAVQNVIIWRLVPEQISCKSFGNSAKK